MKYFLFGAAALIAAGSVAPASAQAVVNDPEVCAQMYPNANCQNLGPDSPLTGDYQRRLAAGANAPAAFGGSRDSFDSNARMRTGDRDCAARFRSYDPASGTYLGRDGARHACQ